VTAPAPPTRGLFYDALAPIYDDWQASTGMVSFSAVAADKLIDVLVREERRRKQAATTDRAAFIDLGCGTGTMLLDVRDALPSSWRLAGADASAGMLKMARRKPGAHRIVWTRATVDQPLPFGRAFDACGAFYDAVNHLPDDRALERAFAAMSAVLRPGGLLVFDVTTLLGFRRWWRGTSNYRGRHWQMRITTDFDEATGTATADTTIVRAGKTVSHTMAERCFDDGQIAAALAAAGLEIESREAWAPFADEIAGKTWWQARAKGSAEVGPWPAKSTR
jgi:SAM-dependent methyltransferase